MPRAAYGELVRRSEFEGEVDVQNALTVCLYRAAVLLKSAKKRPSPDSREGLSSSKLALHGWHATSALYYKVMEQGRWLSWMHRPLSEGYVDSERSSSPSYCRCFENFAYCSPR